MLTKSYLVDSVPDRFVFELELPAETSRMEIVNGNITVNETDYNISMVRMVRPSERMNMVPWKFTFGPFKDHADRTKLWQLVDNGGIPIYLVLEQQED